MMVRRLRVLTLALFAIGLAFAGPARAEIATHTVDEERWGSKCSSTKKPGRSCPTRCFHSAR